MNLFEAHDLALRLIEDMKPHCERCEVAGSIRRKKPDGIKDVEVVAIPKWEEAKAGLFADDVTKENLLWKWGQAQTFVEWIKPGKTDPDPGEIKPDGKYWRGRFANGVKLDLFLCSHDNFGSILMIRTGPADFSRMMVTLRSQGGWLRDELGLHFRGGYLERDGVRVPVPEEEDVFKALKYKPIPPEKRFAP